MAVAGIGLFQLMQDRLAWLDQRQQVLARNVSNADTPGYLPRDLTPFSAMLSRRQVVLARTDAGHLSGRYDPAVARAPSAVLRTPDGNGVSLETELAHVADNATAVQVATQLYSKYVGFVRTALDRAG